MFPENGFSPCLLLGPPDCNGAFDFPLPLTLLLDRHLHLEPDSAWATGQMRQPAFACLLPGQPDLPVQDVAQPMYLAEKSGFLCH